MKALSLFSGAGGMDLGLERAGITAVAFCEIDPVARSVLRRHWPNTPIVEDVRDVGTEWSGVDLVQGGFPCQDISVAGRRAGLGGERSGLWWEFHRILVELRPRWVLVENVAGLLSSNGGRDLGAILGALGDLGYGFAWRVLDAQHFGVPQRRRRVFIVGHLGEPFGRAAEVLLEPEVGGGNPAPGREAGQVVAALTANGVGAGGGPNDNAAQAGHLIPAVTGTLTTKFGPKNYSNIQEVLAGSIVPCAVAEDQRGRVRLSNVSTSVTAGGGKVGQGTPAVMDGLTVRRLTPRECERLMGWPDDWTRWRADGREIADTHRYRLCGNGVVASVAEWIGRRMAEVDDGT